MKDNLAHRLEGTEPGKGMIRFPDWLPDWFYSELCSEQKTEKGWENPSHTRNEAWDLAYYTLGACVSPLLRVENIRWSNPPAWAAPWDFNALVFLDNTNKRFANPQKVDIDIGKLASQLA